jgi:hypothetical protein
VTVNSKEEILKTFVWISSKNSASERAPATNSVSKYTCIHLYCIPGREPADVAEEAGLEESVEAAVHHVHHQHCREQTLLPLVCRQT